MKKKTLLLAAALIATGLLIACQVPGVDAAAAGVQADKGILPSPFEVSVTTDKAQYAPGEKVIMTLKVKNVDRIPHTLKFNTSQRYDFAVSYNGNEVWRWSDNKVFRPVTGTIILKPGQTITYRTAEYKAAMPFGIRPTFVRYNLVGTLTSRPELNGKTAFEVSVIVR